MAECGWEELPRADLGSGSEIDLEHAREPVDENRLRYHSGEAG